MFRVSALLSFLLLFPILNIFSPTVFATEGSGYVTRSMMLSAPITDGDSLLFQFIPGNSAITCRVPVSLTEVGGLLDLEALRRGEKVKACTDQAGIRSQEVGSGGEVEGSAYISFLGLTPDGSEIIANCSASGPLESLGEKIHVEFGATKMHECYEVVTTVAVSAESRVIEPEYYIVNNTVSMEVGTYHPTDGEDSVDPLSPGDTLDGDDIPVGDEDEAEPLPTGEDALEPADGTGPLVPDVHEINGEGIERPQLTIDHKIEDPDLTVEAFEESSQGFNNLSGSGCSLGGLTQGGTWDLGILLTLILSGIPLGFFRRKK